MTVTAAPTSGGVDLARFDIYEHAVQDDPLPWYAALRDRAPFFHNTEHDYWVLSRHEDVLAAAVDVESFSSAHGLTTAYDDLGRLGLDANPPMVMTDPPVHTAFRRLVARGFTPRQVGELEEPVRAFVRARLERLVADGGGDVVADLFKPLPSMVVAHYLGVPEEDRGRFDTWSTAIVAANAGGGAAAAVTREIWLGSGVTNVNTRHPLLLASLATTLWRLSQTIRQTFRSRQDRISRSGPPAAVGPGGGG